MMDINYCGIDHSQMPISAGQLLGKKYNLKPALRSVGDLKINVSNDISDLLASEKLDLENSMNDVHLKYACDYIRNGMVSRGIHANIYPKHFVIRKHGQIGFSRIGEGLAIYPDIVQKIQELYDEAMIINS